MARKSNPLYPSKIKVLILSHSSELAGAERSMIDLFDYWFKKGWVEPHFIIRIPLKNMTSELHKRGWNFTALYYTNWSQRNPLKESEDIFQNAVFNTEAIFTIEKLIKKIKPDVVMTNTIVSPWAAIAANFQRVPHAWFVREYGDIDHQHVFELGREKMMQDINNLSNLVVTNSKTLAEYIGQYINKSKITPLYTPFDLEALEQRSKQPADNPFKYQDSLKLVITGKIAPSKGQDEAARAMVRLVEEGYNTELCVIGQSVEAGDDNMLKEVVNKFNLQDKVHLVGHLPNPLAIVKYADIGIMASKQEAFGRVTFEYMALGLPVVGANKGATPEMVEDGKNGYLYDQGNTNDLFDQLLKYAKDRQLVKIHGQNSKRKAEQMMEGRYNAEALYNKVLETIGSYDEGLSPPLNFSHRWLEYILMAQRSIIAVNRALLPRLIYRRARKQAKRIYIFLRSFAARIFGR